MSLFVLQYHRQLDPFPRLVHFCHFYLDVLMKLNHFIHIGNETIFQLRDVNQSAFLDSDNNDGQKPAETVERSDK